MKLSLVISRVGVSLSQFFYPLAVCKILIECGPDGRPSGEADVYFHCHRDAVAAMSKDRMNIGEPVGELFTASFIFAFSSTLYQGSSCRLF